jgi:arylsulfatase
LANDLAAKNPEKLKELQDLFLKEAVKYSVLPLDDRTLERLNAALVGRPDLMAGRTSLTVYQGMTGMSENVFTNVKNRSHTITAEVEIPKKGANGVILAQAGRFGGWSFYIKDGKPTYTYNWLGLQRYNMAAKQALPAGKATIRFEFDYDGGGVGKGGMGTLFVNGKKVATDRIERTQGGVFSADEGADVGADEGTPVTEAYKVPFKFTGKIYSVTIELKDMKKADHDEAEQARKAVVLKKGLSD